MMGLPLGPEISVSSMYPEGVVPQQNTRSLEIAGDCATTWKHFMAGLPAPPRFWSGRSGRG